MGAGILDTLFLAGAQRKLLRDLPETVGSE